ncbi:hypothetical protein DFS34DRAFT_183810 [Phlyctochytrium arcticum]|nr:hypothetical protein DFS34DRAFT_183810 [Phlyctochytrium arcticum]
MSHIDDSASLADLPTPTSVYTLADVELGTVNFGEGVSCCRGGTIRRGTYQGSYVILKVVDESKPDDGDPRWDGPTLVEELDHEVTQYKHLESLQRIVIPQFCGYLQIWGMLRILAWEDCGTPVDKLMESPDADVNFLREGCFACLAALHQAGIIHGNARLSKFLYSTDGFRIWDFRKSKPANEAGEEGDRSELSYAFQEAEGQRQSH